MRIAQKQCIYKLSEKNQELREIEMKNIAERNKLLKLTVYAVIVTFLLSFNSHGSILTMIQ